MHIHFMNLDLQKPPRTASPFLINIENEALPKGIKGGRSFLFCFVLFFSGLAATLKQRSNYSTGFLCALRLLQIK